MNVKKAMFYSSARADMDRQSRIDRAMCKPGYTWNETIKKCVANIPLNYNDGDFGSDFGGNTGDMGENSGKSGKKDGKSADMAIKQEVMMRQSQGLQPEKLN